MVKALINKLLSYGRFKTSPPIIPTVTEIVAQAWFRDRGDETHRLDYNLNHQSLVLDVGGFRGQWASDIYAKYKPQKIIVYEPHPDFSVIVQNRFLANPAIKVASYGLGATNRNQDLFLSSNATSAHPRNSASKSTLVTFRCADEVFKEENISYIHLLKVNIEGSEYELLDHLISTGWVGKIENLQIQFHDNVADYETKLTAIVDKLTLTHRRTYCYPMVWENWTIRDSCKMKTSII
jgi:FkbM family methyltransferase